MRQLWSIKLLILAFAVYLGLLGANRRPGCNRQTSLSRPLKTIGLSVSRNLSSGHPSHGPACVGFGNDRLLRLLSRTTAP